MGLVKLRGLAASLILASLVSSATVHGSHASVSPTPTASDIQALVPPDGTIAHVMQPVAPARLTALTTKLQLAAQKQPEWWMAQIRKARPGEPVPYDPRLGLTKAEYEEFLRLWGAFTLRKVKTTKLNVKREGRKVTFHGGEGLPHLKGVVLDLATGAVTTPFGTAAQCTRIRASSEQKVTGPWNGVQWELERVNDQTGLGTVVKFALGRLRPSGRGLLHYEVLQVTGQSRTEIDDLIEYDLPPDVTK
jgi:hypothetical protein